MELAAIQNKSPHTTRTVDGHAMSTRLFTEAISHFHTEFSRTNQKKKLLFIIFAYLQNFMELKANKRLSECVGMMSM